MLAGLLHGLSTGRGPADALLTGDVGCRGGHPPGSRVPAPDDLDGIRAELTREPDFDRVLS